MSEHCNTCCIKVKRENCTCKHFQHCDTCCANYKTCVACGSTPDQDQIEIGKSNALSVVPPNLLCQQGVIVDTPNSISHMVTKTFKCRFCTKTFCSKFSMKRHEKMLHIKVRDEEIEKPFRCFCGKAYSLKTNLQRHQNSHFEFLNPKKSFVCEICQKKFTYKHNKTTHIKRVHYPDKYKCLVCGKEYSEKNYLSLHSCRKLCKSN